VSTYFELICIECSTAERKAVETDFNINHGQDYLAALMRHRPALEHADSIFKDPDMQWFTDDAGRLMSALFFFSCHIGHTIRVISEYGELFGHENECNFRGEVTGWRGYCDLKMDHEGLHHVPPHFKPWERE